MSGEKERKVFIPRDGEICVQIEGELTDSTKSDKSVDTERSEEQWTDRNEQYFLDMKQDCLHKSNIHSIISHKNKKRYMWSSLPITVLPLILVNIDYLNPVKEIQTVGLTLVSVLNGINTLYNFSKKCEVHNSYSGKYADLACEIDKIMIRRKKYRNAFDVSLEKISTKMRNIDDTAPQI
jgi:hypothetical protein